MHMRHAKVLLLCLSLCALCCSSCAGRRPAGQDAGLQAVTVHAMWGGGSADEAARLIAGPLERELATITGVSRVLSRCDAKGCLILLQHPSSVSADVVAFEASSAAKRTLPRLPEGCKVVVSPHNVRRGSDFVVALVLVPDTPENERYQSALEFANRIMQIPTAVQYDVLGMPVQEIIVEADRARAATLGVTAAEIATTLEKHTLTVDPYTTIIVQTRRDGKELGDILIKTAGTADIRLKDVARITTTTTPGTVYHVDGEPAVLINVFLHSAATPAETATCLERILKIPRPPSVKRVLILPKSAGTW